MTNKNSQTVEYWDLFRIDGRLEMTVPKGGFKIPPHLYHKTVEVIPTDMQGHILLTQRSMQKRKGAGLFEFPAGSVLAGEEPYEAARRELMEETGLRCKRLYRLDELVVPGMHRFVYLAYIPDLMTAAVRLQDGETMAYRIVSYDQWINCIANGQFEPARIKLYTRNVFKALEKMIDQNQDIRVEEVSPVKKLRLLSREEDRRSWESISPILMDEEDSPSEDSPQKEDYSEDWV